jgi:hypothetical protein
MDYFESAMGIIGAFCIGIAALTIFFKVIGYFQQRMGEPAVVKMKGFLRDARAVDVHTSGGKVLRTLTFVGFTDSASFKGGQIPYQLSNMIVFETKDRRRILLRADSIKMIEEVGDGPSIVSLPEDIESPPTAQKASTNE